ncbi:MAG TPA: SDR family oxidoreductase [Gemmataceae bacterium]|nr:SDR family oxidoreductase [Gemmataceae bacterium]
MLLAGKRALVTGSSAGIGLGVAQAFVENGASVVVSSERPLVECPDVVHLLKSGDAHYIQADMSRPGDPERLVGEAWDRLGGLDVLVNNVGTFREPAFLDLTRECFDYIFGLNVWAGLAAAQEFARRGIAAGRGGRIIFTTSLNASRSEPAHTLYDASKGAVNALTRQLAVELAPHGFTTVAVAPGFVETPLTDMGLRSDPAARRAVEEQIPLRKMATVEDVAMWYVFLASDAANYATGTIVTVDGGLDAQQMASRPIAEGERRG